MRETEKPLEVFMFAFTKYDCQIEKLEMKNIKKVLILFNTGRLFKNTWKEI